MIKCNKFLATVFSVTLLLGNCPKAKATPPYEQIQDELSKNCVRNFYKELNSAERLLVSQSEGIEPIIIPYCQLICALISSNVSNFSIETVYVDLSQEFFEGVKSSIPDNRPFLQEEWQDFSNSFSYAIIAAGVNTYCPRYQQDLENLKTRLEEEMEGI